MTTRKRNTRATKTAATGVSAPSHKRPCRNPYTEITASNLVKIDLEGNIIWKPHTDYGINADPDFTAFRSDQPEQAWTGGADPNLDKLIDALNVVHEVRE